MNKTILRRVQLCLLIALLLFVNLSYERVPLSQWHAHNDFAHFILSAELLYAGESVYGVPLESLYVKHGFINEPVIRYATNPPALIGLTGLLLAGPSTVVFWLFLPANLK